MEGGRAAGLKPGSGSPPKEARRGRPVLPRSVVWRGLRGGAAGAAGSMSSLRRPPIEFLFVSLFVRVCHSKTSFYWAGDPRPQEYRPRRRCEAGPAAPKTMAPGTDATFLWRHAADRRFGAAVDNTRRCRHPGAPAPEKDAAIPHHLSQMRRNIVPPHKSLSRVVGGCFSLCGRSPSGAPMSPVLAAPLFASGCAQSHAKHSPGPSDLVI